MARDAERLLKRGLAALLSGFFPLLRDFDPTSFSPKSILVIRQHNQLGDMLCVVPLLRALRSRYPAARLALMASPVNYEVMEGNRYLDRLILYDKREILRNGRFSPSGFVRFIRTFRGGFDMVLTPGTVSTSFSSDLFAFLSGARVRVGVASLGGEANPSSFFYNVRIPLDWSNEPHRHQTLRNLDLVRAFGVVTEDLSHEMTLTPEESGIGKGFAAGIGGKGIIGFHPGAGKPPNRWGGEMFARAVEQLSEATGCRPFITSGPMDGDVVRDVLNRLKCNVELIENKSIREVASIIKEARLYVTNDTGLLHVAAAVGTPTLALFGPTDPEQWAPRGAGIRYIQGEGGVTGSIPLEKVVAEGVRLFQGALK